MCKIHYKFGIETISGTLESLVHMPNKSLFGSYGRRWVYPKLTYNNHLKGSIMKNLAMIYSECSSDYIADLKTYARRYFDQYIVSTAFDPVRSSYAHFVHMMYKWAASDPTHIDLETVTIADIVALDAPVITLVSAVDAGFLKPIEMYEDLTSSIS